MSIGAFCNRCNSAFCNHCLQINEHNSRMEYDRRMAGMPLGIHPEMLRNAYAPEEEKTAKSKKPKKNTKLLLLRRGK